MYSSLSIGYERYITNQFMVEMVINNQYWFDEMGLPYYALCFMPGYKYYFVSKAKWRNNIWIGGYLMYKYQIDFHSENGIKKNHKLYDHGIGISFVKECIFRKIKVGFSTLGVVLLAICMAARLCFRIVPGKTRSLVGKCYSDRLSNLVRSFKVSYLFLD